MVSESPMITPENCNCCPFRLEENRTQKFLAFFTGSSSDLDKSMAKLAIRIAILHLKSNLPLISSQMAALDKHPFVRLMTIREENYWKSIIILCVKTDRKVLSCDH